MGLTKIAITRPIFILMLVVAAFLLGTMSYRSMRVELNPEVNFPMVTITTNYSGAGPEEINELVSRKIEEAISSVNGLRELTSTSYEGTSSVSAQFELSTSADVAMNDVRAKIDAISSQLPDNADKPSISKLDVSSQSVLTMAFSSTVLNSEQLRDLIDDKISDRFAQISGVASVGVQGGDVREVEVRVKKAKLLTYRLGISDILSQVSAATTNTSAGRVVNGDTEYSVRIPAQFETPAQIRSVVLTVTDSSALSGKRLVPLTDVADVVDTVQERTDYSRLNGKDTIIVAIQKSRDGNAVEISKRADEVLNSLKQDYAADGLNVIKTYEASTEISDSLSDVQFDLAFAIVLVAAIVFVFLHNLRGTIIVALAIPTSIFGTFVAMYVLSFTINNMTMMAMTLAVGVLVDDAIVVLENIYRHLKMGEDPREAAINGRSEIGLAAIAITMADVMVFVPIAMMGGIMGQFFKPMALSMVSAVLLSLFVSFTLTPMLASRWYKAGEDMEKPTGWFASAFEHGFTRFEHGYRRTLEWALRHRWFVFCLGNASLFAVLMFIIGSSSTSIGGAFKTGTSLAIPLGVIAFVAFFANLAHRRFAWQVLVGAAALAFVFFPLASVAGYAFHNWKQESVFKFQFIPSTDGTEVDVNIELPAGSSLAATQRVVKDIEKTVMALSDVKYEISTVGSQSVGGFSGGGNSGSNYAKVTATLYDLATFSQRHFGSHGEKLRYRRDSAVVAELTQKLSKTPGATVTVSAAGGMSMGSPIQMSFYGEDRSLNTVTANKIKTLLAEGAVPGVINPETSSKAGKVELQVIPDRTRVADSGVSLSTASSALRTLYSGDDNTKLRVNGKEYPVRVMMDYADRNDPNLLSDVPLTFVGGKPVYVGDFGKIVQKQGVTKIDRRNRVEEVKLTADLLPGYASGTVQSQINTWLKDKHLVPQGVTMKPLGQADSQSREQGGIVIAILVALVLVYMLLASLYDNLLYPFIIQIAQPQALTGAILGLIITNKTLNIVGMIGIITLVGLVGKNAILLVDYTNTLRGRGRNRHDALVEAGPTRLRPILMTTMALIFGTLPIALALGRGSEFRETLGITIIGGISLSTIMTLVVIPCSYTIFDDLSNLLSGLRGKRPDTEGTESPTKGDSETETNPAPIEA